MKSALGLAAIAVIVVVGVLAIRGDLGSVIGGPTGNKVQEAADKAKDITIEKALEARAVVADKVARAPSIAKEKVADAKEAVKGRVSDAEDDSTVGNVPVVAEVDTVNATAPVDLGESKETKKASADPDEENTSVNAGPGTQEPKKSSGGLIRNAVNAVKNVGSSTEPSAITWPVVSEEDFNKQREAKMAAAPEGEAANEIENAADTPTDSYSSEGDNAEPTKSTKKMTPYERAKSTEEGTLKNPFDYKDPKVAAEGEKIYLKYSCNGCHGGGGGGGMCPPLTNETWVYGGDDDTLYRLITLGTDEFGRSRKGQEVVVGPMPPYKDIIKDEEDMWKIIAYIRTKWGGRDKKIEW